MIKMAKKEWKNCEFPQLCDIVDPGKLAPKLQRCLADPGAAEVIEVEECALDELHYKPGCNCRMVLSAKFHRQHDNASTQQIFYGKLFRSHSAASEAFNAIQAADLTPPPFGQAVIYVPEWEMVLWSYPNDPIWESEACQRRAFLIPRPYGYDANREILWQELLAGRPLGECENLSDLPGMAKDVGACLAAFHGTPLRLPQEMTLDFKMSQVREAVTTISTVFPDHTQACTDLGEKLSAAAARLGPGPATPVHASFKFSHIFTIALGIVFIDLDGANLGDPGYDLGRFIAYVCRWLADEKISVELAEQTIANFCASYNRAADSPVPQERIDWFTACHLIRSEAYKSVKRMNSRLMRKLLEIAGRLCPS